MTGSEVESQSRRVLSSWHFWMGVAYFGLVVVTLLLYVQNGRIIRAQTSANRIETLRIASITANAAAVYSQCVRSIPTLISADDFVNGVTDLNSTLLENAISIHNATPPGTDAYRVQIGNIARLRASAAKIMGLSFPVPSKRDCRDQRNAILAQAVIK